MKNVSTFGRNEYVGKQGSADHMAGYCKAGIRQASAGATIAAAAVCAACATTARTAAAARRLLLRDALARETVL